MARAFRHDRRAFLRRSGIAAAALMGGGLAVVRGETEPAAVAPTEDLMGAHGILRRILLLYREAMARLQGGGELDPAVVNDGARIIAVYVEGFHERLEEEYLFPRFEQAGRQVQLVRVLHTQHQKGRELTAAITRRTGAGLRNDAQRRALATALGQYVLMYEHHAAREDTELFPAFRELMSARELAELGERFALLEAQQFGTHGHRAVAQEVAQLERQLDIHDLSKFTPTV